MLFNKVKGSTLEIENINDQKIQWTLSVYLQLMPSQAGEHNVKPR